MTTSRVTRRWMATAMAAAAMGSGVLAAPVAQAAGTQAAPVSAVFTKPGSFTVPAGVTTLTVDVAGAGGGGGGGGSTDDDRGGRGGDGGGAGAMAHCVLPVRPGITLNVTIFGPANVLHRSSFAVSPSSRRPRVVGFQNSRGYESNTGGCPA